MHNSDHHGQLFRCLQANAMDAFPIVPVDVPRKEWISQDSFDFVRMRCALRASNARIRRQDNLHLLHVIFCLWCGGGCACEAAMATAGEISARADRDSAWNVFLLDASRRDLRRMLAADRVDRVEGLVRRAAEAKLAGDHHAVIRIAKELQKRKPPAPPIVKLEDGSFAQSPHAARQRWLRHFCTKLGGTVETQDAIMDSAHQVQRHRDVSASAVHLCVEFLPPLQTVRGIVAGSKDRKGHSEDVLPCEAFKADIEQLSRAM